MIDIRELRIGNVVTKVIEVKPVQEHYPFVFVEKGETTHYEPYVWTKSDYEYADPKKYNHIAITPLILQGCGFTKDENYSDRWLNYIYIQKEDDKYYYFIEIDDPFYSYNHTEIKNLDHLQNLYYFIVGVELPVGKY